MLKWRIIIFTLLLGAAVGGCFEMERRGLVRVAEQWFLGFLVANGREAMEQNLPEVSKDVVLVKFDEKEREELGGWPPTALDWLMVMKRLTAYSPEVVVVVQPLRWEGAAAEFVKPLREALLPFPAVVMGFGLAAGEGEVSPEGKEFQEKEMPTLLGGEVGGSAMRFSRVTALPDRSLRMAVQAGFTSIEGLAEKPGRMLFLAGDGERLVPSLAAQAVTLFRRAPYSAMQMSFGAGARLTLADEFVVPLTPAGELLLGESPSVPVLEGLELMLPDLGDEVAGQIAQVMGKGKAVVLSLDEREGMQQARAMAKGLAMPMLTRLDRWVDWALAALGVVLCYGGMLRRGRFGALAFGLMLLAIGTGLSLGFFQMRLTWWSPVIAFGLIGVSMLFCFLWPQPQAEEGDTNTQSS